MTVRVSNALEDIFRLSAGHDGKTKRMTTSMYDFQSLTLHHIIPSRSHPHLLSLGRHGEPLARDQACTFQARHWSYREFGSEPWQRAQ